MHLQILWWDRLLMHGPLSSPLETRAVETVSRHTGASLAHILSGSCAGNKEEARYYFMRKLDKHTARATARVERGTGGA